MSTALTTMAHVYLPVSPGTLTFLPGETTKYVPVTVLGDTLKEPPLWLGEWFFVKFHSPSANAGLDVDTFSGLGFGIIGDDDWRRFDHP